MTKFVTNALTMKKQYLRRLLFFAVLIATAFIVSPLFAQTTNPDDLNYKASRLLELYDYNTVDEQTPALRSKVYSPDDELRVNSMPSNLYNIMEGNAILNQPIEIWGSAVGGSPPYNWELFVDDELIQSGVTNSGHFIGVDYTFHTLGKRKVKMIIEDGANTIDSSESVIRVHYDPIEMIRINMRIEKGLLYLYKNCLYDPDHGYYWTYDNKKKLNEIYTIATTATIALAFEEKGHLASNSFYEDPYAELVSESLRYLFTKQAGQLDIYNHSDGIEFRISDLYTQGQGNGKGSYITIIQGSQDYYPMYANSLCLLAIIMSQKSAEEAQNTVIPYGYFAGWTYFDMISDALDLLYWNQGDVNLRGGWRQMENNINSWDGSTQQWPILVFKAAADRWSIDAPQWVIDNAMHCYQQITNNNGGCGYSSSQEDNTARTGGKLAGYSWAGKMVDSDWDAGLALSYISSNYLNYNDAGWAGCFYAMYAVKKGLQLQEVKLVNDKDWYKHMVAWLTGEEIYSLPSGFTQTGRSLENAYGQYANGSWRDNSWIGSYSLGTAHALLILTQAVTVLPPVAVIDDVPNQPPATTFRLDGSHSFHLDLSSSIIQWNWDYDNDGYYDDASGQRPMHPGFPNTGTYLVGLEVLDDNQPVLSGTDQTTINITEGDHPPVAIPIPDSLLPCYAGMVGEPIYINGQQSYDPDGTAISDYNWDTDGDGEVDDMTGFEGNVTFDKIYNGQIGLRVTSNNLQSTQEYVDVFVSDYDIAVLEVKASPVYMGSEKVDLFIRFHNDPASSRDFQQVLIRFYDSNPFLTGNRIGGDYHVDLPIGDTIDFQVTLDISEDVYEAYVYLDPDQRYEEWNEVNNYLPVDVIKYGEEDEYVICENDDPIDLELLDNDFSTGFELSITSLPELPQHGTATILNDALVSYEPDDWYWGADTFAYRMEILSSINGELIGYDTTEVYFTINPLPVIFQTEDTIVCPTDSIELDAGNPGSIYEWSTGDTTQTIWASTTGVGFSIKTFSVTVTNVFECQTTDQITVIFDWIGCTGLNDQIARAGIRVFPNPAKGFVNVSYNERIASFGDMEVTVFDSHGNKVISEKLSPALAGETKIQRFDLSNQASGMYYLYFYSPGFAGLAKVVLQAEY